MKTRFYPIVLLLTGLFFAFGSLGLFAQTDDPNIDRIPDDFLQHQQENDAPMLSTVVTIDGYDNYYLGVDFAEGHISENPLAPGEYFTAFNINKTHHTENGHDWLNSTPSWTGYTVRGDVLTAYDGDGNLYYENMYGSGSIQGCVVKTSTDNGATWSNPVVAISGNDKNWMTADQTTGPYANYVYTVMTNSGSGNFARSTNQGTSFQNTATFATQSLPGMMVCVGANGGTDGGAVYVVTNSGGSFSSTYTFYQSLNGGQSFTQKSSQNFSGYVGTDVNGRNSVQNMRTRPYPFITADNSNGTHRGRLYLVYASNAPAGNGNKPDIFCRYSDNGGSSWSAAVTVNDDFPSNGNHQWHPATWCDYETGRLYVQWMDTRDTPTSDSALIYATYSDDGGASFVTNHAVSNKKMKINCTSCGGGGTPMYLGDYNSIISNPVTSMPVWADFRVGNFSTYSAYFPDYAMLVSPDISTVVGNTASFDIDIPSVKAWDEVVTFTVEVETPSSGSLTVNFPSGNTLSSFPATLPMEVVVAGNVPVDSYWVKITGTGPNGTPIHIRNAAIQTIAIAPPVADFSASNTTPCLGTTVDFYDESTGAPDTWNWTFAGGTPANSSDQNPSGILYDAAGSYGVTLTASNSLGSSLEIKSDYIVVSALPAPPASSDEEACVGSVIPDLYAAGTLIQWYDDPALTNLVFTGETFATGQTDPGVYTYYVTETLNNCEGLATMVTLTIFDLPVVTLDAFTPVCIDVPPFALSGGMPDGGTYSGIGVVGGEFDPAVAGAGDHEIVYSYTDGNGCMNEAAQMITVYPLPEVTLAAFPNVCLNEGSFILAGGMPAGGEYSGTGVSGGMFYPEIAGLGTHMITYIYSDANGCMNYAEQSIMVNDFPHPNIGPDQEVCEDQTITLDGTTAGAVSYEWYPGGQTTAQITVDSSGIGVGSQMFIVQVTNADNCVSSDSINVTFIECTGIGELAGVNNISLYPNPTKGDVTLQVDTRIQMFLNVKVYNNRGLVVYEEKGLNLNHSEIIHMDLSNQPAGIYLVMVYNEQGKWVEKLILSK